MSCVGFSRYRGSGKNASCKMMSAKLGRVEFCAPLLRLCEISGVRFGDAIIARRGVLTFKMGARTFLPGGRTLSRYRASGAYETTERRVECESECSKGTRGMHGMQRGPDVPDGDHHGRSVPNTSGVRAPVFRDASSLVTPSRIEAEIRHA